MISEYLTLHQNNCTNRSIILAPPHLYNSYGISPCLLLFHSLNSSRLSISCFMISTSRPVTSPHLKIALYLFLLSNASFVTPTLSQNSFTACAMFSFPYIFCQFTITSSTVTSSLLLSNRKQCHSSPPHSPFLFSSSRLFFSSLAFALQIINFTCFCCTLYSSRALSYSCLTSASLFNSA